MKKIAILSVFLVVVYSFVCKEKESFSEKALAEKLTALDDSQPSFQSILEKQKGKTMVIEVWASWCGDCVKAMPSFKDIQSQNPDITYVFISLDKTTDKWKAGIEKHQLVGNHYFANDGMKGAFGKAIDLNWIPRYIVVDKNGKIALYNATEKDFDKIITVIQKIK
jgi:thiol-disulfide isomerase/thioredoxin